VTGIERSRRIGRISDEGVHGVRHLMTQYWELIHRHFGLVLAVDRLVGDQTGGRDHVSGHAISDEEDDILGLANLREIAHHPMSHIGLVAIIVQRGLILAGLVESYAAVSFGGDVDKRGFLCVLGEKIYRTSAVA
jgi:hypothetical protein